MYIALTHSYRKQYASKVKADFLSSLTIFPRKHLLQGAEIASEPLFVGGG